MSLFSVCISSRLELYRYHVKCDQCGALHQPGTLRSPFNDRGDIADDTLHSRALRDGWKEHYVRNIRRVACPACQEVQS